MTIPPVRKPHPTAPIGRCPECGSPTYDVDALNFRCDACGVGVVGSVASQNWRRCPACFRTGRSPIVADTDDGSCPVCQGTGWITDADNRLAEDELQVIHTAIDNALDGPAARHAPERYTMRSILGSVALFWPDVSRAGLYDMRAKVRAYAGALAKRIDGRGATKKSPAKEAGPRLTFLRGSEISAAHRPAK